MKGAWNRRGSAVTANGFFTVLKSTGWFPTFRLPDGYRYLIRDNGLSRTPPIGAPTQKANGAAAVLEPELRLRQIDEDRRVARIWVRWVLLLLAGCGATLAMLRWMMN